MMSEPIDQKPKTTVQYNITTQIQPRTITLTLPAIEIVGADGNPIPIGQGHFELRLRTRAMTGLRLLLRGMEHSGEPTRQYARHKTTLIEHLLAQIADAYDALPPVESKPKASKESKISKESKTDNI